ncbi:MAG: ECF RNA polymerase sigma factor SigW [Firmicutes bacterium ADurb.Bin419]|nr:MAG: ECF RNA polymerase sigma factor SigW [Firmicutes bacterium ADurb.Bin419]
MDTDKILVKQILNGKTELFTELVNRYYSKITSFIIKMNVNSEDAKDISQDIFVKIYNNLYKYDERWQFSTWIFRIAINTLRDSKRKKSIKTQELGDYSAESKLLSPEEHIENLYQRELIKKMFESLEDDLKAMLILKYYNELSFKEIGDIFKKSPESVKMKVIRARKKLCKTYGKKLEGGEFYEM